MRRKLNNYNFYKYHIVKCHNGNFLLIAVKTTKAIIQEVGQKNIHPRNLLMINNPHHDSTIELWTKPIAQ